MAPSDRNSNPSVERLEPRARVWAHQLASLYAHSIFSLLPDGLVSNSETSRALAKGANIDSEKQTLIRSKFATLFKSEKLNPNADTAIGFSWANLRKPGNRQIRGLIADVIRVAAYALIVADRQGSLQVSIKVGDICRVASVGKGKVRESKLQDLAALLNGLSRFDCYNRAAGMLAVVTSASAWTFTIKDQDAQGYAGNNEFFPAITGSSSILLKGRSGTALVPLNEDQKVKMGIARPNKAQAARGLKEQLDWHHYAVSAPRLVHSADLGLNAQEEALYCWLERNLTSAGPRTEAYKLFPLDGREGQWLGALSNKFGQGTDRGYRGNRLDSIVKNSYFPINKETWKPKHWYKVLRSLMGKLDGVLLMKFPGNILLQDAKDWEAPPLSLEQLTFFPYLPLDWHRKINVVYAAFERGRRSFSQVEYNGVLMDAGDALKQKRQDLKLTHKEVGAKFRVSDHAVKSWETGERKVVNPLVLAWIQETAEQLQNLW